MRYLSIILAIFVNFTLVAQPLKIVTPKSVGMDNQHLKYADDVIENAIIEGYIPGAVLAIVRGGCIPYIKAYGDRSLFPKREPMSIDTIFDIASCTKPVVTALATMQLMEQGRLALWDRVDRYIPDFSANKSVDSLPLSIRINHLMTHTSGLDPYVLVETLRRKYSSVTRDSLIDHIVKSRVRYAPGDQFRYSCLNFITLQHIIESITGETLRDYAKENLFDPLGMNSTDFIPLDTLGQPLKVNRSRHFDFSKIAPTEVIGDSIVVRGVVHDPLAREVNLGVSGNAGLFSTATDLAKLASVLLNNGVYNKGHILSPLAMKTLRNIPDDLIMRGRALGWDVNSAYASNKGDFLSQNTIAHTGFTGTSIVLDLDNDVAIILLTNAVHVDGYSAAEMIHLRGVIANIVAASILE